MWHSSLLPLLLLGSLTQLYLAQDVQTSQPPGIEGVNDPNMTKRLIEYWAGYTCFSLSDDSQPNVKEQCKEACFPGGITSDVPVGQFVQSSQTCWINGPEADYRTGKPLTEEQKNENPRTVKTIKSGYCVCDDPIVSFLGDFFIRSVTEMGKILQKVMCPTLMALDLVVEIGSAAIPGVGKAITVGMRTGVKTAKMFKHAYDAQEAAMEWASMFVDQGFGLASEAGCKTPFSFGKADLAKKFVDFADAPDELVPGINYDEMPCPKGKKASKRCKEKNGEDDNDDSPSRTGDNNQPTQTRDQPSATTSSTGPTAKVECAAIGRNDMESLLLEINPNANEEVLVKKRTVGTTLHSRRLEARKPKEGNVCEGSAKRLMKSKNYPSSGNPFMKDAFAYGYNIVDDCSDYGWGEQKSINTRDYHTEHVLEWSMVLDFFTSMNSHPDFKAGFEHPDPDYYKKKTKEETEEKEKEESEEKQKEESEEKEKERSEEKEKEESEEKEKEETDEKEKKETDEKEKKDEEEPGNLNTPKGEQKKEKVDFCTYWVDSWVWPAKSKMPNPDPAAPVLDAGAAPILQTPLQWFAEAYPFIEIKQGRRAHEDEFILLQVRINQIAKNNMFAPDAQAQIYSSTDMDDMIKRKSTKKERKGSKKGKLKHGDFHEQPRVAIQRMRSVVGTFLYMKEKRVNDIFIAQVDRIGYQLENIENALAKNPRTVERKYSEPDENGNYKRVVTFRNWEPQKLKEKWFEYMDKVYEKANKKGQDFMRENLKRLNDEYNNGKLIKQADVDKERDKDKQNELKVEKQLRDDMKDYISKLEAKWAAAKDWPKPKWNAQAPSGVL